jgi:hypothetical protein
MKFKVLMAITILVITNKTTQQQNPEDHNIFTAIKTTNTSITYCVSSPLFLQQMVIHRHSFYVPDSHTPATLTKAVSAHNRHVIMM